MSQDYNRIIKGLLKKLAGESLELLDFDQIKEMLEAFQDTNRQHDTTRSELRQLQHDYRRRLTGMLKVLLAGSHDDTDVELAAALADEGHAFTAAELIRLYSHTAARFRKKFPASFRYIGPAGARKKDWLEHKI